MKATSLSLQTSVGASYDQTRTTLVGRASQKTVSGKLAVGTPLISFADVITDANITPLHFDITPNGKCFIFNAPAAGVGTIAYYNFDFTTGAWSYVGKLAYNVPNSPATTHTVRSVRVDDSTSALKIFVSTVGTVTANGGLFMLGHGTNPVTVADFVPVGFATLAAATAANQKAVYFLQETGGTNLLTASQGMGIDIASTRIYVGNNPAATFQGYVFNYSATITTVNAGGITPDMFVHKTGTLPGVTATILLLNNFNVVTPTSDSGVPANLIGQTCISIPASTGFNIGRISEWTNGATSWPTLTSVNVSDSPSNNIAITPLTAHFSSTLQRIVYQTSAGRFITKKFINSLYELIFGNPSNSQFRTANPVSFYEWGGVTVASTNTEGGWIFQASSSAGQIGVLAFDLQAADIYDTSYVISKVVDIPLNTTVHTIRFTAPIRSFAKVYYRTTGFGSSTGNWIAVPLDGDMSGINISTATQIQFKLMPRFERDGATVPLQFYEAFLVYTPGNEISDNWVGSVDNTSTGSPSRSAFRLVKAYTTSVPTLYFRAYDDSGNLVASANTSTNPTLFQYSTNNGSSWNSLGTIPNTPLTTEVRYNWTSPPGVRVTVSLRES